ncbi:hypothetical protein BD310DRAFT_929236 [Dichomitus squalens]|uniref:Uncharacterized protein n=1 Tax=Dichomitus squalens TaxID=114155 RepID=A0A4Q9PSV0_9APHY|nr:hypothetical protein BD310DRAFT_929236 [Dichomitus squalens]
MEAYPSSTCLPRHLRLSVWMHRWPHITSWSCLFPVSVPEFLSCVVSPSSQVRVRDGLPVTFLAFYNNKQRHILVRFLRSFIGRIPAYPTVTFPPRIQPLYTGPVSLYPWICDHISVWTRSHMPIRPHSPHTPWIHPLIPRIRFLYPGFTSFT